MTTGRFNNQVVLISGGAGGAGRAASRRFAAEGAQVAIVDVQLDAGRSLVEEIEASGRKALFIPGDVSQAAAVQSAVQQALAYFGEINILFNHAGTVIVKPFLETTEADWDRLMAINVKSMFLMTQAVLPGMIEKGKGVIINTASISGFSASAMESAYCTTKGAILQLTRAIAVEFRDQGIRCNAISPGFIRTPHGLREMEECVRLGIDFSNDDIVQRQGRFCEPEEIAGVAVFLASEDASFVNGASITVDNTWTAST
ncbi:SDR family NAD(P)-dependent oxidoreductase [Lyngbya confervoides]|uniref:SDR family oxidoreductase n=1 Tax=Lyngbya confervoides BDU141951 TaxID=1574623 RepID=A0ABD4T8K0_9CYAN|nr:SDR family oxidoreductase [Lyngbya confervoides]MCM1984946.1 SDR family oxidoreductase [Lyngbya confervoides BDU141951]